MMGNAFGFKRWAGRVVGLVRLDGTEDGEGDESYWMRTPESGDKSPDRTTTKCGSLASDNVGELSSELGKLTLSVFGAGLCASSALRPPPLGLISGKKRDGNDGFNAT